MVIETFHPQTSTVQGTQYKYTVDILLTACWKQMLTADKITEVGYTHLLF